MSFNWVKNLRNYTPKGKAGLKKVVKHPKGSMGLPEKPGTVSREVKENPREVPLPERRSVNVSPQEEVRSPLTRAEHKAEPLTAKRLRERTAKKGIMTTADRGQRRADELLENALDWDNYAFEAHTAEDKATFEELARSDRKQAIEIQQSVNMQRNLPDNVSAAFDDLEAKIKLQLQAETGARRFLDMQEAKKQLFTSPGEQFHSPGNPDYAFGNAAAGGPGKTPFRNANLRGGHPHDADWAFGERGDVLSPMPVKEYPMATPRAGLHEESPAGPLFRDSYFQGERKAPPPEKGLVGEHKGAWNSPAPIPTTPEVGIRDNLPLDSPMLREINLGQPLSDSWGPYGIWDSHVSFMDNLNREAQRMGYRLNGNARAAIGAFINRHGLANLFRKAREWAGPVGTAGGALVAIRRFLIRNGTRYSDVPVDLPEEKEGDQSYQTHTTDELSKPPVKYFSAPQNRIAQPNYEKALSKSVFHEDDDFGYSALVSGQGGSSSPPMNTSERVAKSLLSSVGVDYIIGKAFEQAGPVDPEISNKVMSAWRIGGIQALDGAQTSTGVMNWFDKLIKFGETAYMTPDPFSLTSATNELVDATTGAPQLSEKQKLEKLRGYVDTKIGGEASKFLSSHFPKFAPNKNHWDDWINEPDLSELENEVKQETLKQTGGQITPFVKKPFALAGSISGIVAPFAPLGYSDSLIVKSDPIFPNNRLTDVEIQNRRDMPNYEPLGGDSLTERLNNPAARKLQTSIETREDVESADIFHPNIYYDPSVNPKMAYVGAAMDRKMRKPDVPDAIRPYTNNFVDRAHRQFPRDSEVFQGMTYDTRLNPTLPANVDVFTTGDRIPRPYEPTMPRVGVTHLYDNPVLVGAGWDEMGPPPDPRTQTHSTQSTVSSTGADIQMAAKNVPAPKKNDLSAQPNSGLQLAPGKEETNPPTPTKMPMSSTTRLSRRPRDEYNPANQMYPLKRAALAPESKPSATTAM
jgi:hypothetical protein